jgi:glycosyltransferase involved in cell wall biosynthesis/ubiquinone/menaquinone biosynthesis C-methylase UbiE
LDDSSFDTVAVTECLDGLADIEVDQALQELFRVAKKALYLQVNGRDRAWWEGRLINVGFRKHPRYFTVVSYEAIESEAGPLTLLMEKPPGALLVQFPLTSLAAERDLHMDMAREAGRRSHAHLIRYHQAALYIRPGDRVLDAACGLGYGSHILLHNSLASEVIGIDASSYAVEYANVAYGSKNTSFREGRLPDALNDLPASSVDFIASFETLEHLEDPDAFLAACARVLTPGGRIFVSVPNDWSEEDGRDPNPHHFHLYDWGKLLQQVSSRFLVESAFGQSASRKKSSGKWVKAPLEWRTAAPAAASSQTSEWCLLVAMSDPTVGEAVPYREGLFPESAVASKSALLDFAGQYRNPWLIRSLVSIGPRMSDPGALEQLADKVADEAQRGPDQAAALCVLAYRALEQQWPQARGEELIERFTPYLYVDSDAAQPIEMRWAISLWYVKGLIELSTGALDEAANSLRQCATLPFARYSPLLATKTVDATFRLGVLQYSQGAVEDARRSWRSGISAARDAVQSDWNKSFGDIDAPPDFAFREITELLDLSTRCATALSLFGQLEGRPAAMQRVLHNKAEHARGLNRALSSTQEAHDWLAREFDRLISQNAKLVSNSAELEADLRTLDLERTELRKALAAKESELRLAKAEHAVTKAELERERDDTNGLRGWVPRYRWLFGHLRRRLLGRGVPVLPEAQQLSATLEDRLLVEASGLFDPEWYIAQYPDIAGADPLTHYLDHGGREGRAAGPDFDSAYYLGRYHDVAAARINPLVHYIRVGAREGREITGVQSGRFQSVKRTIDDLAKFEPELARDFNFRDGRQLHWNHSFFRTPLFEAWTKLFNSLERPYEYLVFIPWLTRGGADLVAVNALRAAIERHGSQSTLLVVADYDRMDAKDWLPPSTNMRVFSDLGFDLQHEDRVRLVETLIMTLRPKAILNINSHACWDTIKFKGGALSSMTDLYATAFCHDYTPDGQAVGYVSSYFRACIPHLKKVYSDNANFINQLIQDYGLPATLRTRLANVPQPVPDAAEQRGFLIERKGGRLPILWASRLARQKNIELLIEIAGVAPTFQFDVYGQGELAERLAQAQSRLPNLAAKGTFSAFEHLPTERYAALLFTSLWEGLPNTLLSAAAAGIPIIASNVGGISELVDDDTGWLIRDFKDPQAYLEALEQVRKSPDEAQRRVERMLQRVRQRHTWGSFTAAFAAAPSFLD